MQELFDVIRIATGLRMARAAVGWSQVELANRSGIAKTTLARAETLDGGLRAEQLAQILRLYRSVGVEIDFLSGEEVTIKADRKALELALGQLQDEFRRSDRKKTGLFFKTVLKVPTEVSKPTNSAVLKAARSMTRPSKNKSKK